MKFPLAIIMLIATVLCLTTALEVWGDSHARRRRRLRRQHDDRQSQKQESAAEDGQFEPNKSEDASDEPESDEALAVEGGGAGGGGSGGDGSAARPSGKSESATPPSRIANPYRELEKLIPAGSVALVLAAIALFIGARIVSWARSRESTQGPLASKSGP